MTSDRLVRLGWKQSAKKLHQPLRLVTVEIPATAPRGLGYPVKRVSSKKTFRQPQGEPYTLILCTDRLDLPADVIALIYQYRWKVELFFRLLKSVFGCRHLLSDSYEGVSIQVYAALIATLLLAEYTGQAASQARLLPGDDVPAGLGQPGGIAARAGSAENRRRKESCRRQPDLTPFRAGARPVPEMGETLASSDRPHTAQPLQAFPPALDHCAATAYSASCNRRAERYWDTILFATSEKYYVPKLVSPGRRRFRTTSRFLPSRPARRR